MPRIKKSPDVPYTIFVVYNLSPKGGSIFPVGSASVYEDPNELDPLYEDELVVEYKMSGKPRRGGSK